MEKNGVGFIISCASENMKVEDVCMEITGFPLGYASPTGCFSKSAHIYTGCKIGSMLICSTWNVHASHEEGSGSQNPACLVVSMCIF